MKRVLLTGSSGQVGSRLTRSLSLAGFDVIGVGRGANLPGLSSHLQCDLLSDDIDSLVEQTRPELLIHLAWETQPGIFWESSKNSEWLDASIKLFDSFKKWGGMKIAVAGSCAEYNWKSSSPHQESEQGLSISAYGKAKLDLLNFLKGQSLPFLWTRTFFQFGGQEASGRLIPSLIDSLHRGEGFTINKPNDVRDFIYVDDVVRIVNGLILLDAKGVFNVATGAGTTTRELAEMIASKLGGRDLLSYIEQKEEPSIVLADLTKLRTTLGTITLTPIRDAIEETIRARVA